MGENRAVQQLHTHTIRLQYENGKFTVWIHYVKHKDTKCSQFVFLWSFCGDAERHTHTHTMEMARLNEENCRKLIVPVHCITPPLASFSCIHHTSVSGGVGNGVAAAAAPKTTRQNRTIESYVLIVISMFYASYKMRRATFRRLTTVFHSPNYTLNLLPNFSLRLSVFLVHSIFMNLHYVRWFWGFKIFILWQSTILLPSLKSQFLRFVCPFAH